MLQLSPALLASSHTGFIPKLLRLKYQVIWLNTQKDDSHPHLFHQLFTTLWFFKQPSLYRTPNRQQILVKGRGNECSAEALGEAGGKLESHHGFPTFKGDRGSESSTRQVMRGCREPATDLVIFRWFQMERKIGLPKNRGLN